ncbi:CHASE domain-containing protein [Thiomonas sp.]
MSTLPAESDIPSAGSRASSRVWRWAAPLALRVGLVLTLLVWQTTRGGAAFYSTSPKVDDDLFRDYVRALNLPLHQPGVMGLGHATRKPRPDIAALQLRMVAEGLTDFHIRPASSGSHVSAILYLEPLNAANKRAIGYDM